MKTLRDSLSLALCQHAVSLLDSGLGERLELFAGYRIRRPSSLALWKRSLSNKEWENADATYIPEKGWKFSKKPLSDWQLTLGPISVKLLLQENGQVGLFPEHLSYFENLSIELEKLALEKSRPLRVLNLFAYTGLATIWCALHGAEVTHIELSKRILTWAKENLAQNGEMKSPTRFIPEDACAFLEREIRRGSSYDLVISDPPSFSRISKTQSWDLDDIIITHIEGLTKVLEPKGSIFITSHHHALSGFSLENIFRDYINDAQWSFETQNLSLTEQGGIRRLACGTLLVARR
jgi:23S rRNA (cytosine1962-C5)-methyltransferase